MRRFLPLLRRFGSDERGVFGIIFAIMAIVLVAMSGAVVDYVSVQQARTRAQVILDAAALALQPQLYNKPAPTEAALKTSAQKLLDEQFGDADVSATVTDVSIDLNTSTIDIDASLTVPTNFVRLVGVHSLTAQLLSEATRGSVNLEVAVALDTTGSMGDPTTNPDGSKSSKIADLRSATNLLIDLVVQDVQTPTYTKMAFVPYSNSVNVTATYADKVRGAAIGPTNITNATWTTTAANDITGATKERPVKITTAAKNNLVNNGYVYITGVKGMTQINNKIYKVKVVDTKNFQLLDLTGNNIDGRNYDTYQTSNADSATGCAVSTCEVVVTSNAHGIANNEYVEIAGVKGLTDINGDLQVNGVTTNTFVLPGMFGPSFTASHTYTSGGTVQCLKEGCQLFRFLNASSNSPTIFPITNCVSERTVNAYAETAPSVTPLGRTYSSSSSGAAPCTMKPIVPLTTDKASLHTVANSLNADGSTGGHIGLAWAWYMLSPNFAYLWPSASRPVAYNTPNTQKILILMTDGAFNSPYCKGVVAKDAISGSGSSGNHINCNAPNGSSIDQANSICAAIKAPKTNGDTITVYTVGFDIGSDPNAQNLMANCATDSSHAFLASNGDALRAAFVKIGQNIASLRVSK
ncbi:MAG TPA: TadE/TadG family type IV pilus assembly protein [Devosiaceae bacterium]|jgi:Flp pilus assembly protein TadG